MRVVIAGGHGKIALLLERLLADRGDQAVGLIAMVVFIVVWLVAGRSRRG